MELSGERAWLESLKLGLALWEGECNTTVVTLVQCRGNLVPTQAEMVQQAEQQTEQENKENWLSNELIS